MITFFYTLIIYPVESIIEQIAVFANLALRYSHGATIVFLSMAVSVLTLPLYEIAERWQQVERDIQEKLRPKIEKIKQVFKGDEKHLILYTYYRQNHYHPIYAIRGMFALLLQIPFFIAAYHFLSNLEILRLLRETTADETAIRPFAFFFLTNLGRPDGLLSIGSLSINVMPFAMTLINIISVEVYAKGLPFKDRLQLYAMALIFLVLLYAQPSGLVLYWTVNNIFSLFKNITHRYKIPSWFWYVFFVVILLITIPKSVRTVIVAILLLFLTVRYIYIKFKDRLDIFRYLSVFDDVKVRDRIFYGSIVAVFLLAGLVIPANVVVSSPAEFSYKVHYSNPFFLLGITGLQAAGLFLLWPILLYLIFPNKVKRYFSLVSLLLFVSVMIDTYFFPAAYGILTEELVFAKYITLPITNTGIALNIAVTVTAVIAVIFLLHKSLGRQMSVALAIAILSFGTLTLFTYREIAKGYADLKALREANRAKLAGGAGIYRLSKTGQNVMIFMLDRAMGLFIPPLLKDFPELGKSLYGFTLYPNTVSFCIITTCGAPPLFGGYEYTPEKMNERKDDLMVVKHNESLTVLPRLFSEHGWTTTVTDASWANYSATPDNSIFAPYPGIRALNVEGEGTHAKEWLITNRRAAQDNIIPYRGTLRNLLRYSFMQVSPVGMRNLLYNGGRYLTNDNKVQMSQSFINSLSALSHLPRDISLVEDPGTLNVIVNYTTHTDTTYHEEAGLFLDDATVAKVRDRSKNDFARDHYYGMIFAFRELAKFFDYMRKENVYDNTRIILAADHGYDSIRIKGLPSPENFKNSDHSIKATSYMPLLMVKDFHAPQAPLQIDNRFMTNADVPMLATEGLAAIPSVNPFSKKRFLETTDKKNPALVTKWDFVHASEALRDKKTLPVSEKDFCHVKENIFKEENWSWK